jgi:hypothetical protein
LAVSSFTGLLQMLHFGNGSLRINCRNFGTGLTSRREAPRNANSYKNPRGAKVLRGSVRHAMVAMMAGQNAIEELTPADLGDLRECIEQRLVFSDQPRLERLPWYESLDWADFHDKEILQAWAETYAGRA